MEFGRNLEIIKRDLVRTMDNNRILEKKTELNGIL
jgi:hypothetical protein